MLVSCCDVHSLKSRVLNPCVISTLFTQRELSAALEKIAITEHGKKQAEIAEKEKELKSKESEWMRQVLVAVSALSVPHVDVSLVVGTREVQGIVASDPVGDPRQGSRPSACPSEHCFHISPLASFPFHLSPLLQSNRRLSPCLLT